ncbi:MAG: hypothetical protein DRJ09_04150 [Bacteroidetes bacterium]|nr:MAG: hypothetical protein DRJ09_04150 [Bacteroidota bacterium]
MYFCYYSEKAAFLAEKEHISDFRLIEQIQKGNVHALEILFERYYEPLCNFAFLFLKNSGQTEELVSDVFIRVWENRNQHTKITYVKAYLYRSVKNAVISHLRKNRPDMDELSSLENISKHEITPESLLIRKDLNKAVGIMIKSMPHQAGLVFRMHKMDGLSYKEIASTLGLSIKTIENHMGKALRFVRELHANNPDYF